MGSLANVCLVAVTALSMNGCHKDDPKLASPKSAARTLFQAMYDSDVPTAKSCVIEGAAQSELVEGTTKMMFAMRGATDAAIKRYGDEFTKLAGGALDASHIDPKQIDAGSESIDGDTAKIVLQNRKAVLCLVRKERVWKVDLVQSIAPTADLSNPQAIRIVNQMCTAMARAADQTKVDIEGGKYPDAKTAVNALLSNMKIAIEEEKERLIKEYSP